MAASAGGAGRKGLAQPPLVDEEDFMARRNTSAEALGNVRRLRLCGRYFYAAPGWWAYLITTSVTGAIVYGNMFVTWKHLGLWEYYFCWLLLVVAHICSFQVITTDPGIYPRLLPDETDPLRQNMELVFCRVCRMRRPPRTSHCYDCNMCVLAHDHHCSLLGGCVGVRNLRWFTAFLLLAGSAGLIGLLWQLRYLVCLGFGYDLNFPDPVNSTVAENDPLATVYPPLSLAMLLLDVAVVGLVGAGGVHYALLTLTDTTRRESQRQETSFATLKQPRVMLRNIRRTARPPHSLVEPGTDESSQAEDLNGRLV